MTLPRIALATCADVSPFARDDAPFEAALRERGAHVQLAVWDDPAVAWSEFDAVMVRTTWDYHQKANAFAAWIDDVDQRTRLINPPQLLHWNRDKGYLRELEAHGLPIVPTSWVDPSSPRPVLEHLVNELACERAFLKPAVAANADGTLRFDVDEAGITAAHAHLQVNSGGRPMMLQPYLDSVEAHGEISLIYCEGEFSHAVRKIPKPGDYRVQDDHGASDEPHTADAAELRLGQGVLRRLPAPPCYARVDMLEGPRGERWLVELELIEPSLFFRHAPSAAARFAEALLARCV